MNKYEIFMEDGYGHFYRQRFEASSDEEALKIANKEGFGCFSNNDCIWRVIIL